MNTANIFHCETCTLREGGMHMDDNRRERVQHAELAAGQK